VQIETPVQGLCGSIKNHTGTNRDSSVYVALERMILVQIELPGFRLFYNE
jgi:hypothetical protein